MKKNDEGFTLIELLIVIVILGILATVVVFAVGGITDKGEVSACKADRKTLEVAHEAYYANRGEYAPNDEILQTGTNKFLNSNPEYWTVTGSAIDSLGTIPTDCVPAP